MSARSGVPSLVELNSLREQVDNLNFRLIDLQKILLAEREAKEIVIKQRDKLESEVSKSYVVDGVTYNNVYRAIDAIMDKHRKLIESSKALVARFEEKRKIARNTINEIASLDPSKNPFSCCNIAEKALIEIAGDGR